MLSNKHLSLFHYFQTTNEIFEKRNQHLSIPSYCDQSEIYEPPHGKTNKLHLRKQRRRSASRSAKLISAFVFATRIVQFLFYLNPKFQASSSFLCLYRPVWVGPVRKPHCWFSHEAAHMIICKVMMYISVLIQILDRKCQFHLFVN